MSFNSRLKTLLTQDWLREKLTLEERAELLYEITTDLDNHTFQSVHEFRNYLGRVIQKAMEHLNQYDTFNTQENE